MTYDSHMLVLISSLQKQNVLRVFTFGSPPIFEIETASSFGNDSCSILDAFDLPTDIVYSYNQPWDPIVRLFSKYDPLYPLIDDLGTCWFPLYPIISFDITSHHILHCNR